MSHYISGSGQNDKHIQTEDGQQEIIKVYLSFQLRRAKTFREIKHILSSNKISNTSLELYSLVLKMLNLTLFKKQQLFV